VVLVSRFAKKKLLSEPLAPAAMEHAPAAPTPEQLRRGTPWCWVVCNQCMPPCARCIRAADHQVGARRLERHTSPIGALHQVRPQRRGPTAPELGWHGSRLGAFFDAVMSGRGRCEFTHIPDRSPRLSYSRRAVRTCAGCLTVRCGSPSGAVHRIWAGPGGSGRRSRLSLCSKVFAKGAKRHTASGRGLLANGWR
jgi:hypothetical protein